MRRLPLEWRAHLISRAATGAPEPDERPQDPPEKAASLVILAAKKIRPDDLSEPVAG